MAKEMDDGEYWLPSDFLADDFVAGEEMLNETESDEDDSVAGLTRHIMTHSFLREELQKYHSSALKGKNPAHPEMAKSPQSTLWGMGSWSFSSNGSPDETSLVSSPPSTPFPQLRDDPLDLLYAAAGQVERLGLNGGIPRGLLASPQKHSNQTPVAKNPNNICGFYSSQDLIRQQLQAARFYQLKRQQLLKQQQQHTAAWERNQNRATNSAWQQQQQQPLPGSGMTAVFLNGSRRPANGTGVFLPRRIGSPNEPRKKPTCSTVLLPDRVVQALNLNLEDLGVHPRLPDSAIARSNFRRKPPAAAAVATGPELRLPQEWTY